MGFKYTATTASIGFDYNTPLTSDAFSTQLLHMDNQRGKPYLSGYISDQIIEFINPPNVVPDCFKEIYLIDPSNIDLENSPIIRSGYLKILDSGKIDPNCYAVKDGVVRLYKGNIDRNSEIYIKALHRLRNEQKKKNNDRGQGGGRGGGGKKGGKRGQRGRF